MSERSDAADPFGQIADAFVEEFRQGRRPSLEEYASRYPEHASEIREILPALVLMERAKSQTDSLDSGASGSKDSASLVGRELGDYRIVRELGRGGMGVVYEAEQVSLGRRVALKVLAQQALRESKQRRRFEREARAAARLHHTNIVPVFGVGEEDGLCYYAMQFIRGLGLDKVLDELKRVRDQSSASGPISRGELRVERREGTSAAAVAHSLLSGAYGRAGLFAAEEQAPDQPDAGSNSSAAKQSANSSADNSVETFALSEESSLPTNGRRVSDSSGDRAKTYWQSIARIGVQVAEALQYAHDQGITHRDIKPSNLLLDLRGTVWVTDFGLAKSDDQQNLTHSGDILGTLRYLPPEAFEGRSDARSDVYSLGLTLYELLTLRPAFDENERYRLVKKVTSATPPRIERVNVEVPRDLATIVHRAIERDPPDRYQTARQLAADLERFIRDEPIHARRTSLLEQVRRWSRRNRSLAAAMLGIAALLLVIACGATGAAIYYRQQEEAQRELHRQADALARRNQRLAEENRQALLAALDTSKKLAAARTKAEEQEEMTRRNLYCAQMTVAYQSWQGHRGTLRTQSLLDDWRPQAGADDLRGWEWFYIHMLCHRELTAWPGHSDAVTCVAYARDGTRLASAARDGTVRIWKEGEAASEKTLIGHQGIVYSVSWDATGKRLASAGDDGVIVWDRATSEIIRKIPASTPVFAVAFAPDDCRLAVGIKNGPLEIWDANKWERLLSLEGHQADVYTETISFNPDGTLLAAPSRNSVTIWHVESGEPLHVLEGHTATVQAAVFSPDGKRLASTSRDATIKLWDVKTGQVQASLAGHTHGVASIAWNPSGTQMASAAWDGTCRLWDAIAQRELAIPGGHARHVFSVAWHPQGQRFATGGDDNLVKLWSAAQSQEPAVLVNADDTIRCQSISPNGSAIVTGNAAGNIELWDATTGAEIRSLGNHPGPLRGVAFDPHSTLVAGACGDGSVVICKTISGEVVQTLRGHSAAAVSVGWNHAGTSIVTTGADGSILLWDAASGNRTKALEGGHVPGTTTARFSPDGTWLASGGDDGVLCLWDLSSGQRRSLRGHISRIMHIAWSPDGSQVATAGADHTLRTWDAIAGSVRFVMSGHREVVAAAEFSRDGRRLLSSDTRGTIKLWDVATGVETLTLRGPIGPMAAAGWSPDGTRIFGSCDAKILIWDAAASYRRLNHVSEWHQK